jgi:uncharacterized protein YqeY
MIHDPKGLADHSLHDLVVEAITDIHAIKSAVLERDVDIHELEDWKDLEILLEEVSRREEALHVRRRS